LNNDDERSTPADLSSITEWESYLANYGRITLVGQQELRSLLRVVQEPLRSRVVQLLNPRCSPTIEVPDSAFGTEIISIADDNYEFLCRYPEEITAPFDVVHGYYVKTRLELLS
jgi:hypothetical protein